jgi:hypothetical protein
LSEGLFESPILRQLKNESSDYFVVEHLTGFDKAQFFVET